MAVYRAAQSAANVCNVVLIVKVPATAGGAVNERRSKKTFSSAGAAAPLPSRIILRA